MSSSVTSKFVVKKVFLASDHAGFKLKEFVKKLLEKEGLEVRDFGTNSEESCDYPDFIFPCAEAVSSSEDEEGRNEAFGIVFGGSGIGECIAANKVPGVRCAFAYDDYTAKVTREHNDSNMLALGARTKTGDEKLAGEIVLAWLSTPFSKEERHERRIAKISFYESEGDDGCGNCESHGHEHESEGKAGMGKHGHGGCVCGRC